MTTKKVRRFGEESRMWTAKSSYNDWINCCGAAYISGFGATEQGREILKKDIRAHLRSASMGRKGMLCAIINHNQRAVGYDKELEAAGFKLVFAAHNPVHGEETICYLYAYNLANKIAELPEEKKAATKKKALETKYGNLDAEVGI